MTSETPRDEEAYPGGFDEAPDDQEEADAPADDGAGLPPFPEPDAVSVGVAGIEATVHDPDVALEVVATLRDRLAQDVPPALRTDRGALLQVADAEAICGADHLRGAVRRAVAARRAGEGIADDTALDVLLYAAGVRQIQRALDVVGLPEGATAVAAVAVHPAPRVALDAVADALDGARDDALLEPNPGALDALGVSEAQRQAVPRDRWPDLALEKGALLEVDK